MIIENSIIIFQFLLTGILGILGYLISKHTLNNTWLRTLSEINESFWSDDEIKLIRCAITYPEAYKQLQHVLVKRLSLHKNESNIELKEEEYLLLDKLDKFLHIMERTVVSNPMLRHKKALWSALYFDFWLEKCMDKPELHWYVNTYYPTLSLLYSNTKKAQ